MAGKNKKNNSDSGFRRFVRRMKSDEMFRNRISLYFGATINAFFVGTGLYSGIRYHSVWFTALAVYYAVLTAVKIYIGLSYDKKGKDAWRSLSIVGTVLVILNIALLVMISIMIANPSIALHEYGTAETIIVGIWAFYLLVSAAVGVFKQWKEKDVMSFANKIVSLLGALVSVLMFQTAMIATYSGQLLSKVYGIIDDVSLRLNAPAEIGDTLHETLQMFVASNRITGVIIGVLTMFITGFIIVKGVDGWKKGKASN